MHDEVPKLLSSTYSIHGHK